MQGDWASILLYPGRLDEIHMRIFATFDVAEVFEGDRTRPGSRRS